MDDKVSIIMPVYNCEKYLAEAINSVKNQTYTNWELIIVDDCSNDNSIEIIEQTTKQVNRKVIIKKLKKNVGVAKARNKALEQSTGKYICYLDSDDMWSNDKIEKQIQFMKNNNYAFTYTSYIYLNDKSNKKKKVRSIPKKLNYNTALKNTAILCSTVMINTTKIDKKLLKMPNVPSEDTATWWKILKNGYNAYGLDDELTIYRVGKKSLSSNKLIAIKRIWNLYSNIEKLSFAKKIYCFCFYAINAVIKRI